MHGMPIDDQVEAAVKLLEQALHELHEGRRRKSALKHHEGPGPLIGDGRNHVAAKTLPRGAYHRGLSDRRIARPRDMVATQAHLAPPSKSRPSHASPVGQSPDSPASTSAE